jgi:hypothetical protein
MDAFESHIRGLFQGEDYAIFFLHRQGSAWMFVHVSD